MDVATITLPPTLELTIELIIMPPAGSDAGRRNIKITTQLEVWSSQNNLGVAFDSSSAFKLPNGADRSPDASWIKLERWDALTPEQKEKFAPLCPDFVVELLSPSDSLEKVRASRFSNLLKLCQGNTCCQGLS